MRLKGIIVPIGTPVDSEERTDEKGLRKLTRHLIAVRLYQAARGGDMVSADELQQRLIQLFSIFDGDIWGSFEVALQHLGICEKVTISPFASITDAEARKRIIGILDKYLTFAASSQDSKGQAY